MMRGVQSRKQTPAEITAQTKEMFDNVGFDVNGIEIESEEEAIKEIEYLETTIQPSSEWDDIVSAISRCMGLINGGALEFDSFKNGLSKLYIGLTYAATNSRSALVKTSCLLISLMAREMGSSFDLMGDYIGPLGKQLSNGTQFIADCSKNTIHMIARCCPGRKIFSYFLAFCSKRGNQQKTVAAESLVLIMENWPPEAIGTNWPRFYTAIFKFLEDPSPYVRAFARKAARSIAKCSKQRSNEFFMKCDSKTRKQIQEEGETKESSKEPLPRVAFQNQNESEEIATKKPKKEAQSKEVSWKAKPKGSGIPIRAKKPVKKEAELVFNPFSIDKTAIKTQLKMEEGRELGFLSNIRDILDSGNGNELSPIMKNLSQDLLKCMVHSNTQVVVSSLAVFHDILPSYSQHFAGNLAFVVETLLKLVDSSNPRASSNALLVLQELTVHFDIAVILNVVVDQLTTLSILNYLAFIVRARPTALLDTALCERILKCAFNGREISDLKSRQVSAGIISSISQVNSESIGKFSLTLSEEEHKSFADFCRTFIPGLAIANVRSINIDLPLITSLSPSEYSNEIKSKLAESIDEDETRAIIARVYSEINNQVMSRSPNMNAYLRLVQSIIQMKGTLEFEKIIPFVLHHWRCEGSPAARTANNIVEMVKLKGKAEAIIASIQNYVRSRDPFIARNSVDLEAAILSGLPPTSVRALLPTVTPAVCDAFETESADLRKSILACIVQLYTSCGADVEPHLRQLTLSQKKLVEMSIGRKL